jgi:gamma-glutamylaminecyclotransferase
MKLTDLDEIIIDADFVLHAEEQKKQEFPLGEKHFVFVYGSLKRGFSNHSIIQNSKFMGNTETADRNYRMFSLSYFPTVAETEKEDFSIIGELYEVDAQTLHELDLLEGNGHLYNRKLVKVYSNLDIVEAWMYLRVPDDIICPVRHTSRYVYTNHGMKTQEWCQE